MEANTEKNIKNTLKSNELTLKRCLSDNIIAPDGKINTLIEISVVFVLKQLVVEMPRPPYPTVVSLAEKSAAVLETTNCNSLLKL